MIKHQHRMNAAISEFSRDEFYNGVALKDANKLQTEIRSLHNQTHLLLGKSNKSGSLINVGGSLKYCIRDVLNK